MRFLSIYKHVEEDTLPSPEEMAAMGKLVEEGMKAGWLLSTEGCLPSAMGVRVRKSEGKVTVTDGPFTESKEVVGGFAILKANSKQEAIELAKMFLGHVGEGECELRQLYEMESTYGRHSACGGPLRPATPRVIDLSNLLVGIGERASVSKLALRHQLQES